MQRYMVGAAVLALTAGAAQAGGIDRSGQSIAPIFEDGNYVEFSFGHVKPKVSGEQVNNLFGPGPVVVVPGLGQSSGNMTGSYNLPGFAFKTDINEKLSAAIILDSPYGADVDYSYVDPLAPYAYTGSNATIDSRGITAVLKYDISDRFSVHAGARNVTTNGNVTLFNGYQMETTNESDWGYLIGAAYEIPDIALRAALTYNSAITHNFTTTENGVFDSPMETVIPQSVNFDFQTGIAEGTLLMASVRWVEWTAFDISPTAYVASPTNLDNSPLVSYDNDTFTYSLGIGRQLTDKLSGSVTLGYEKSTGGFSGNLGPTDGYTSISLGLKYQVTDGTAISGGIRFAKLGDAETQNPSVLGQTFGDFDDNTATAIGLKISHSF